MTEAVVRRAALDDLEALLPLVAGYRAFYGRSPDAAAERALMHAHLSRGTSAVFVAVVDGTIDGFAQIVQTISTVELGPELVLADIFVAPRARRRGIASLLLDASMRYAEAIGATGMYLETAVDNEAAQAAYQRAGWTREAAFYKYNAPLPILPVPEESGGVVS